MSSKTALASDLEKGSPLCWQLRSLLWSGLCLPQLLEVTLALCSLPCRHMPTWLGIPSEDLCFYLIIFFLRVELVLRGLIIER